MERGLLALLINVWWGEVFFEMEGGPGGGEMMHFSGFLCLAHAFLVIFFVCCFLFTPC